MGILLNWKGGAQPTPILDPSTKPRLLDEVRHAIRRKHYSLRTEQSYVQWIRRFILYHGKRHPREMGAVEVERFLTHLAVDGKVASSTQNQAPSCFSTVLEQEVGWVENVEHTKRPGGCRSSSPVKKRRPS